MRSGRLGIAQFDLAEAPVAPGVRRFVGHQVVGLVVVEHPAQAAQGLVRAADEESAGAVRERGEGVALDLVRRAVHARLHAGGRAHRGCARVRAGEKAPAVQRVHDRARARGRVEHAAQVDGARLAAARPVEEAVRDHEAELASGHAREAAHDVLERVQGHVRIAQGLVQELDGLALDFPLRHLLHRVARDPGGPGGGARRRLPRGSRLHRGLRAVRVEQRPRLRHHGLDPELEGAAVALEDEGGLLRSEPRAAIGRGGRLAGDEALDRLAQHGTVARELLDGSRSARGDDRDRVVGRGHLVHEAAQRALGLDHALEADVQVVDEDDDLAAGSGVSGRRGRCARHGGVRRGRRRSRGGSGRTRRSRARHHEELRRGLDLSVLEDLEVGLSEVADHRALGVEDHGVELDDFRARAGHDGLRRSGGGHDGEEEREGGRRRGRTHSRAD